MNKYQRNRRLCFQAAAFYGAQAFVLATCIPVFAVFHHPFLCIFSAVMFIPLLLLTIELAMEAATWNRRDKATRNTYL